MCIRRRAMAALEATAAGVKEPRAGGTVREMNRTRLSTRTEGTPLRYTVSW